MLYHLDYSLFQGGFLGVDIFFVISGYLISRNILADVQQCKFDLATFYVKRIRRLFPALVVTIFLTLIAAYFFLASANMPRLGKVAGSAIISLSNFFFLGEQGYFDADVTLKPLLHTWSLGVEEQFYLLWPLLLLLLSKIGRKVMLTVAIVVGLLSLVAAEFYHTANPNMVFYMLPFRLFEFICGFLAVFMQSALGDGNKKLQLLSYLGIGLMIGSAHLLDSSVSMPGLFSMVPCLGVMLVLVFPLHIKETHTAALLESIGKSSYSIYLVHWPLIVFCKLVKIDDLVLSEQIALFALSVLLGILMWKFVEQKFRYKEQEIRWLPFKVAMPVLTLLVLSMGYFYTIQKDKEEAGISEIAILKEENIEDEMKRYWQDASPDSPILEGDDSEVIVMGNSHAVDLIYAFKLNGFTSTIVSMPTTHLCYHFGATAVLPKNEKKCVKMSNNFINRKEWKTADAIFLHDHWPVEDLVGLKRFLLELKKKTDAPIYVFGPKMVFKSTIPQLVKGSGSDDPEVINNFAVRYSDLEKRLVYDKKLLDLFLKSQLNSIGIHYISLLGDAGIKKIMSEETLEYYYFDKSHLTETGASKLGSLIKQEHPALFEIKNSFGKR